MIGEATSPNRGQGSICPRVFAVVRFGARRLRGVDSILSGIASRNRPFDDHRARLTAWYEQLVQRSQPFIGGSL